MISKSEIQRMLAALGGAVVIAGVAFFATFMRSQDVVTLAGTTGLGFFLTLAGAYHLNVPILPGSTPATPPAG